MSWRSEDRPDAGDVPETIRPTRRAVLRLGAGLIAAAGAAPALASGYSPDWHGQATQVVVQKSARRLHLLRGETTLASYSVGLGSVPQGHKLRSGDGRTPEGRYYIDRRNPRSEFYLSLGISYPNPVDYARARAMGFDPGGDIFIHGEPMRRQARGGKDWTAGCIAVSNAEMEEIWAMVPTGVPITLLA